MKAVLKLCFSSWSQLMWTGASAADTGSAIRAFSHYGRVKEWGTDQSWLSAGSSRPKTDKHNHPTLQSPQRLHYWKQSERIWQWARVTQKDFVFIPFFSFGGRERKSKTPHTLPQLKPAVLCGEKKKEEGKIWPQQILQLHCPAAQYQVITILGEFDHTLRLFGEQESKSFRQSQGAERRAISFILLPSVCPSAGQNHILWLSLFFLEALLYIQTRFDMAAKGLRP